MKDNPLISVITAAYYGSAYLSELIESIRAQDYQHFEHIVVDDGSTDGGKTVEVLKRYPHLNWWSQENAGQYAAQNAGLKAAEGDIIAIINQDDAYMTPDTFSTIAEHWRQNPKSDFVYGKMLYFDEDSRTLPFERGTQKRVSKWFMQHVSVIPHAVMFVRKELLDNHSILFDANLKTCGDWDFLIRVSRASGEYHFINRHLAKFRIHSKQTTVKGGRKAFANEEKIICKRYGKSYLLHNFLRKYLDVKILLKSIYGTIRTEGMKGIRRRTKNLFRRRDN